MATKQHDDCFTMTPTTRAIHGTRNRQAEYKSKKKGNVDTLEAFCGRKKEVTKSWKVKGRVDCQACVKAMAAQKKRLKK